MLHFVVEAKHVGDCGVRYEEVMWHCVADLPQSWGSTCGRKQEPALVESPHPSGTTSIAVETRPAEVSIHSPLQRVERSRVEVNWVRLYPHFDVRQIADRYIRRQEPRSVLLSDAMCLF